MAPESSCGHARDGWEGAGDVRRLVTRLLRSTGVHVMSRKISFLYQRVTFTC